MNSVKPVMKKGLFVFSFLLLFFLVNLGTAFAETTGWSWPGENADGLTGRFSGTVNISTDRAVGKYSVKVATQDDLYDWGHYGFYNTFKSVDTDKYSQVSIWVKPGPGAKVLRFWIWDDTEGRTEIITSDKNHDGYFKVGEDLESGKWNNLILDLKQTNLGGVAKNASDLQLLTNDFSTWYWDETKVIYSPVTKLNISSMPESHTQLINGSVRYKLISSSAYDTTSTVLTTQTDINTFPKGRIDKININSGYVNTSGVASQLQNNYRLISGTSSSILTVSGDGNRVYYLNSSDLNKLYYYDKITKVNKKLADYTNISQVKTGYSGDIIYFVTSAGTTLYYYDIRNNSSGMIDYLRDVDSYSLMDNGMAVSYISGGNVLFYQKIGDLRVSLGGSISFSSEFASSDKDIFLSFDGTNTGSISRVSMTPNGWKWYSLVSSPTLDNIQQIISNKDGSILYIIAGGFKSLDVDNKVIKKLNVENFSSIIKVSDDNKVFFIDYFGYFMSYAPDSDTSINVRPANASNNAFSVDDSGFTMIYNESTGIFGSDLRGVAKPDRYLLSFDSRQSWVTFKDGKWEKISNSFNPSVSQVQTYGMTSDEVNALDAGDLGQLYQDGQELYSVDVAVLFQTPDPSISPQINGITVTLNGEGVKGTSLQYPKQQIDYNSSNWRLIRKIYPIELQPKEAEVRYFLSNDDGTNLKSYQDGLWSTYQPTLLNNPKDNWSDIIQFGMTAEELRNIPSEQLNSLLPANKISVVYVTEVDDFLTEGYSSKIAIDYVENLFVSNSLVLKITLTDGSITEFSGLSKDQVEDFMNWINERQYNRGPIFYTIKTNGTTPGVVQSNKFINYYMIQSVDVDEMQ